LLELMALNLNWVMIPPLIAGIICFVVGIFCFRGDPKDRLNRMFFAWMMLVYTLEITIFLILLFDEPEILFFGTAILCGVLAFVLSTSLHLAMVFQGHTLLGGHSAGPFLLHLPAMGLGVFSQLGLPDNVATDVYGMPILPNSVLTALSIVGIGYLGAAIWVLMRRYRRTPKIARRQIKSFIPGFGSLLAGLVFVMISGWFSVEASPFFLLTICITVMCLLFSYAVFRYRVLNLESLIRDALISITVCNIGLVLFLSITQGVLLLPGGDSVGNSLAFHTLVLAVILLGFKSIEKVATNIVESISPDLKWKEARIQEAYLINYHGLLINHYYGKSSSVRKDPDTVSGMLTAISDFCQDAFDSPSPLSILRSGDKKFMIEHGKFVYMVLVFSGQETMSMKKKMEQFVKRIEKEYRNILKSYHGNTAEIEPIIKEMAKLLH